MTIFPGVSLKAAETCRNSATRPLKAAENERVTEPLCGPNEWIDFLPRGKIRVTALWKGYRLT